MRFELSPIKLPELANRVEGPAWEDFKRSLIAVMFTQRTQVFANQGGASGRWAPLSPSYAARRRRRDANYQILQDKGTLRNSFSASEGPGSELRISEVSGDEVRIATPVEYAAIQNFGGTIQNKGTTDKGFGEKGKLYPRTNFVGLGRMIPAHSITIPARPFDEFSNADKDEIQELTETFLNG